VVCIGQNNLDSCVLQIIGRDGLHRTLGSNWHKHRCLKTPVGCRDCANPAPGVPRPVNDFEFEALVFHFILANVCCSSAQSTLKTLTPLCQTLELKFTRTTHQCCYTAQEHSQDQHCISIAIESVSSLNRQSIRLFYKFQTGKGRYQKKQRAFR
jgi:hypothetical protein